MQSIKNTAFTFIVLSLAACGDSAGETTVVTTVITTSPGSDTSPLPSTETDGDETTTSTTDVVEPTSTTGDTTEVPSLTTTGGEFDCTNEGQCDGVMPTFRSFCEYVDTQCAAHDIESQYCQILADKCEVTLGCTMCFELWNYCTQIGTDCDAIADECGCVAEALEVE